MQNNNNKIICNPYGGVKMTTPLFFLIFVSLLILTPVVQAGTMQITPLRATLNNSVKSATFDVFNPSDQELSVQLQAVEWEQDGIKELYNVTSDLLAVPALFKIPPREKQTIRAALMRPNIEAREKSYRLIFTEIPPLRTDKHSDAPLSLNMRLQLNLPIFVMPESKVKPEFSFDGLSSEEAQKPSLKFSNRGNQHVRISTIRYIDTLGNESTESMANYFLPGTTKTINPKGIDLSGIKRIILKTDTLDELSYDIN